MSQEQNNLIELEKLFGKPEDGITGCFLNGIIRKKILKKGVDTGYCVEGNFNSEIVNPQGKK